LSSNRQYGTKHFSSTKIIFGEKGDPVILGVTTLEIFGLEVDVVRGVLKEAELLLL
jgi:hypothetical protein